MRRIALIIVSTVAIIVLLFSYKTSRPASSTQAPAPRTGAHIVSGPAVVSSKRVASSARPPDVTIGQLSAATTSASATPSSKPDRSPTRSSGTPQPSAAPKTSAASDTAPASTPITAPIVVDGSTVDTYYGPVQVEVTISNNEITRVTVPQYPSGTGRDVEINSYAIPQLVAEVLSAQSATIDAVSGATYTSQGFQTSLQSALDAANFGR
jgi:uncharacterized protein with FMN-binding domain